MALNRNDEQKLYAQYPWLQNIEQDLRNLPGLPAYLVMLFYKEGLPLRITVGVSVSPVPKKVRIQLKQQLDLKRMPYKAEVIFFVHCNIFLENRTVSPVPIQETPEIALNGVGMVDNVGIAMSCIEPIHMDYSLILIDWVMIISNFSFGIGPYEFIKNEALPCPSDN